MKFPKYVDIKIPTKLAIAGAIIMSLVACGTKMGVLPNPITGNSRTVHLVTAQKGFTHFSGQWHQAILGRFGHVLSIGTSSHSFAAIL